MSYVFVQVKHLDTRREVMLPAAKTMSYISLFTVSGHGFMSDLIQMRVCVCMHGHVVYVCVYVCVYEKMKY